MRNLLGVVAICGAATIAFAQSAVPKDIGVCDLFRDPSRYNGKRIAVRGVYHPGGHGLYLDGGDCGEVLTTRGYRWPSRIWVPLARDEYLSRGLSIQGEVDAEIEIATARSREGQRRGGAGVIERVTVTYVGLFETHNDLGAAVVQGPIPRGVGFGQGLTAPGQLFVTAVRDILVEFVEEPARR